MVSRKYALSIAGLAGALSMASGQLARAQAPAKDTVKIVVDAGYVQATGNTSLSTFNVGDHVKFAWSGWSVRQELRALYSTKDHVEAANQQRLDLALERAIAPRLGIVLTADGERNPFAGFQRHTDEGLGVAIAALTAPSDKWSIDLTLGDTQVRTVNDSSSSYFSGTALTRYTHTFAGKSSFEQSVRFTPALSGPSNNELESQTSMVGTVTQLLAVKLSYGLRYVSRPVPGFRSTDVTLTAGLQLTL